jgi:Cu+-exporting ATPase
MGMNHTHTDHSADASSAPSVTELLVNGMTCNNCARHVTEALQSVPGVRSASVMLDAQRASVRWAADAKADVPAVIAAVKNAGYEAKAVEAAAHDHGEHQQTGWHLTLGCGVLGTVPLMAGEWIFGLGMDPWFQWLSFALASVVQILAGAQFYRGAWRQLKIGSSNMDTLVALGSTTAFGYSAWALLSGQGGHVYFMEAAAIITLISVGHWLEARVSARASSALKSLLHLAPQTARKIGAPSTASASWGSRFSVPSDKLKRELQLDHRAEPVLGAPVETEVPVSELRVGDLVALRPGDHVPTDGEVVEGDSAVDESMLTGESVPVDKTARSELCAGTVNLNGHLVMRVTATGESTELAHIIAAVQRAQTSRANIQRLADRVSNVFVPVVVLVALAAGFWWGLAPDSASQVHHWLAPFLWPAHPPEDAVNAAFIIAAAVLIIACPCAMGLATPAAIMASANAAARRGILIRDGVALEKAGSVTAIIFDKTGTLTVGKPEVVRIAQPLTPSFSPSDGERVVEDRVREIASSLARHSSHPISQAIARISSSETHLAGWQEVRGAGVQGKLKTDDGGWKMARLGSLRWLREAGVDLSAGDGFVKEWSGQGATIVGLALDQTLQGLFAARDTLKPGAAKVVQQLQRHGLKTFLLTGDNALTAASIAKQTGIATENVFAEVRPEQKAEFVKKLQQRGERVAFVGDGINDAPALEQADLGIAVGRASDIAREAADIILLKSEIEAVPEALGLARATLRTIKQNLFWAFFYNVIGVPLAALGFMSPVLCAAAMGVSDLVVIGNALQLRRWRLESKL